MLISITSPVSQTYLFLIFLLAILVVTSRRQTSIELSKDVTAELKGFSILAIVFAHIGYYLFEDTRFLFPLSISAGVGVNLFLFLSGYGLTYSMMREPLSVWEFYKKRLGKIFLPLWLALIVLLLTDWALLERTYPFTTTLQGFLGFFPKAHLYESINAPLWYFTFIVFYYLLYPIVFFRYTSIISAVLLGLIGYLVVYFLPLPVDEGVLGVYRVHIYAFPLGVLCAALWHSHIRWIDRGSKCVQTFLKRPHLVSYLVRGLCLGALAILFSYTSVHADVGKGPWLEQRMSLFTMFTVIGFFLLKPIQSRFLVLMGIFSYEIYLFHWPLMYRYDFLYKHLPASIATFAYLCLFLGIAFLFQRLTACLSKHVA